MIGLKFGMLWKQPLLCLCYFPLCAVAVQVQNIRVLTRWWMKHGNVVTDYKRLRKLLPKHKQMTA